MSPTTLGLLRHALTAGGTFLVARGYLQAADIPAAVSQAETAIGAVVTLASVGSFALGRFRAWRAARAG